jgi:hypothetical protein
MKYTDHYALERINESTSKKVVLDFREVDITIPRDREIDLKPKAIKKHLIDTFSQSGYKKA